MEEKKKGMLDVLAADEIHRYVKARRAVNDDTELSAMVKEYEEGSAKLVKMIQTEGFDADEAVRLSNDMDYIGLRAAYKAMNEYLASVKGQVTFSCGGDCSSCAEACAAKPEQKDGEA